MKLAIQFFVFTGLFFALISFKSNTYYKRNLKQFNTVLKDSILTDSIIADSSLVLYTAFKENAHASYYHDKFTGRKTASGQIFDNSLYTAAHKTLKFGTKVKVTNIDNGKSIVVTINDRGPFVKGREIDLSKKAFMEIAKHKLSGQLIVNIEIVEEPIKK